MRFDLGEFVRTLSYAIDNIIYLENLGSTTSSDDKFHQADTAILAILVGKALNMTENELEDIYLLSLLHDCGFVRSEFVNEEMNKVSVRESIIEHCIDGDEIIKLLPLHNYEPKTIYYHHENWDGSGYFGCYGKSIPIASQIIRMCEIIDEKFTVKDLIKDKRHILEELRNIRGTILSPELTDSVISVIESLSETEYLLWKFKTMDLIRDYTWEDIASLCEIALKIIDGKSKFTYYHSISTAKTAKRIARILGFDNEKQVKIFIAGCLHDLGKLWISKSILEKPGPLSKRQRNDINRHPLIGKTLLYSLDCFKEISLWIEQHHEMLDGSGYPNGLIGDEILLEAQIITISDIFSALKEDRPYRHELEIEDVIRIIESEFNGKISDVNLKILKKIAYTEE